MAGLNKEQRWNRDRDHVVSHIVANPRSTGRAIAYHTGVAVTRVHQIIAADPRANELARDGMVAVQAQFMKPSWYDASMTRVPVVRGTGIPVGNASDLQHINDMYQDEETRDKVLAVYYDARKAIVMPSTSMRKRRKAEVAVMSGVQIIATGYQEKKKDLSEVNQRLERIEQFLLTAPKRGRPRKNG